MRVAKATGRFLFHSHQTLQMAQGRLDAYLGARHDTPGTRVRTSSSGMLGAALVANAFGAALDPFVAAPA